MRYIASLRFRVGRRRTSSPYQACPNSKPQTPGEATVGLSAARLRHHFFDKIAFFFFYAFTHLKAREAGYAGAF
jgi:hypothetical protein